MIRQVDRERNNECNYSTFMRYTQQFESKMIANIPSLQVLLLLLSQLFLTDAQAQMTRPKHLRNSGTHAHAEVHHLMRGLKLWPHIQDWGPNVFILIQTLCQWHEYCCSPKSIVGLVHPSFPVNRCKKTNKIAQYAAFITFIICKCRKPNAILAYFYFVITYSLGDMIWRTILCLLSDNKPYITDLWIIIPLGCARILSYNLDNSLSICYCDDESGHATHAHESKEGA